jgi:hypothetical protein
MFGPILSALASSGLTHRGAGSRIVVENASGLGSSSTAIKR